MKTAHVALGYKGLAASNLANFAETIYNGINGNINFTIASTFAPALLTATNLLKTAVSALKPGDKVTTSTLHDAEKDVKRNLRAIAALVDFESNGNETTILSSGFSLRTFALPSLKLFTAKQGKLSGTVDLDTNSASNTAYVWEMSPDPIGLWTQLEITTLSKTTIIGLTPGVKYWFRVALITSKGKGDYSDPYMVHVV